MNPPILLRVYTDTSLFGDKVRLPTELIHTFTNHFSDGIPLTLRLERRIGVGGTERVNTTCGILDFSAPSGQILAADQVLENLGGARPGALLSASLVELDKAESCTFIVEDATHWGKIKDIRTFLERSLRTNFATLSLGDIVTLWRDDGSEVRLRIANLEPSDACCIIDTDMSVDITIPEGTDSSNDVTADVTAAMKKIPSRIVGLGEKAGMTLEVDCKTFTYVLCIFEAGSKFHVSLSCSEGDIEAYASPESMPLPIPLNHMWGPLPSCVSRGLCIIDVLGEPNTTSFSFYVGIRAFDCDVAKCKIVITTVDSSNTEVEKSTDILQVDGKLCSTCREMVPFARFDLHSAFCDRHNIFCEHCDHAIKRTLIESGEHWHCMSEGCPSYGDGGEKEIQRHFLLHHASLICECGIELELAKMRAHKLDKSCPSRQTLCRFCGDWMKAGSMASDAKDLFNGFTEHESVCGARTAVCPRDCGRPIMLKNMGAHLRVHEITRIASQGAEKNKEIVEVSKPLTSEQRNAAWGRAFGESVSMDKYDSDGSTTASASFPGEPHQRIMQPVVLPPLFAVCKNVICGGVGGSSLTYELCPACFTLLGSESHPTGFLAALIRKYHEQLTVGCGRSWCQNKLCGVGESANVAAVHALNAAKLSVREKSYEICTADRNLADRRVNANQLVAMGFPLVRCLRALAIVGDDVAQAAVYLLANNTK